MALDQDSFEEHLGRTYGLELGIVKHLVAECAAFWNQDLETWIRQRHLELQKDGLSNTLIFYRLEQEMKARPFAAPPQTERQIRRRIYG